VEIVHVDDPGQAAGYGLDGPFSLATFDIVLQPDADASSGSAARAVPSASAPRSVANA